MRFPGKPQDDTAADLSLPAVTLLQNLNILGTGDDLDSAKGVHAFVFGPPQSVAIIEAGATALTKWWTAGLGTLVTATSIAAAAKGIWTDEHDSVRIAIVGAAAGVLFALSLAIAWIVSADVRGRAAAAGVQIQARAQVATAFLTLSRQPAAFPAQDVNSALLVAGILRGNVEMRREGQADYQPVSGVRLDPNEGLQVRLANQDWVAASRFDAFRTA